MRARCEYLISSKIEHRFEPGHRKPSSGTLSYAGSWSGSMTVNTAFRNPVTVLKKTDQFHERLHLLCSRRCVVEITHKTNSYSFFICPVVRCLAMGSGKLLSPAECNLNLAITTIASVAYNKIVSDAFPMIAFSVLLVKYSRIAVSRCRVMYHDSGPLFFQP